MISAMYPGIPIEDDPDPYECKEDYDGLDPQYSNRRWHFRVEREPLKFPDGPQNDTRHTCPKAAEEKMQWQLQSTPFPIPINIIVPIIRGGSRMRGSRGMSRIPMTKN